MNKLLGPWAGLGAVAICTVVACSEDGGASRGEIGQGGNSGEAGFDGDEPTSAGTAVGVGAATNGGANEHGGAAEPGDARGGTGGLDAAAGAAGATTTDSLRVVTVTPADASVDVSPSASIRVEFSRAMDASTFSADNAQILDGAAVVPGEWSCELRTCTFTPSERLSLLVRYDLHLSTHLAATDGTPLADAFMSSFRVRDGVWSDVGEVFPPEIADPAVHTQQLAADAHGNFLVVWEVSGDGIWARWYHARKGWAPSVQLQSPPHGSWSFDVSVTPEGNAVVAWADVVSEMATKTYHQQLLVRRFKGGVWQAAQPIGPAHDAAFGNGYEAIQVGMSSGRATVVARIFEGGVNGTHRGVFAESTSTDDWQTTVEPTFQTYPLEIWMLPAGDAVLSVEGGEWFVQQPGGAWQKAAVDAALTTFAPIFGQDQTLWFGCGAQGSEARIYPAPGVHTAGSEYLNASTGASCDTSYAHDHTSFWRFSIEPAQGMLTASRFDSRTKTWPVQPTLSYQPSLATVADFRQVPPALAFDSHGNGLLFFQAADPVPFGDSERPTHRVAALRVARDSSGAAQPPVLMTAHPVDTVNLRDEYRFEQPVVSTNGAAMVLFRSGMGIAEAYTDSASGKYCVFE